MVETSRLAEAANLIQEHRNTSVAFLQKHMKISFSETAKVLEGLEAAGVVSKPDRHLKRKILGGRIET